MLTMGLKPDHWIVCHCREVICTKILAPAHVSIIKFVSFDGISAFVSDMQSAWLLLLHCASARANYQLRVVHPSAVEGFARTHDAGLWQCLSNILHIDPAECKTTVRYAGMALSRVGVAQCDWVTSSCVLGELVRLSPDDPSSESRCRCCSDH